MNLKGMAPDTSRVPYPETPKKIFNNDVKLTLVVADKLPDILKEKTLYVIYDDSCKQAKQYLYYDKDLYDLGYIPTESGKTINVEVSDKSIESITGAASNQALINQENVTAFLETLQSWNSLRTYKKGKMVFYNGGIFKSLTDFNSGNVPSTSLSNWERISPYRYIYKADTASTEWKINHNLNDDYPYVVVITSDDEVIQLLDITYVDKNNLTINFNNPIKGTAIIK